jgi:hypothetical protein
VTVEDAVAGRAVPERRGVTSDQDAPTPFERARRDPDYLARLRAAYRGDDDLLDALWWLDRPEEPGPSGAGSPSALLAAARRDLYGPTARPGAAERLGAATLAADHSRAAALAALHQVGLEVSHRRPTPSPPPDLEPEPPAPHQASAPLLSRRVALGVLVPALAAAAVLGAVAGLSLAGPARKAASAVPAAPLVQHFEQTVRGNDALAVFGEPNTAYQIPGGLDGSLDPATARRLVVLEDSRIIGVRTGGFRSSGICLLVVDVDEHVSGSCSPIAAFRKSGLILERPKDRLPADVRRIHWYPDGRVVWWSPLR